MSKGAHDIFALVINLLGFDWYLEQVTIYLFKATKTIGQALADNLTIFFLSIWIEKKIIRYVKNEGSNLNAMTITLK
jgi:hypothetical protein